MRRIVVLLAAGALALTSCRTDTVTLDVTPAVGDRFHYRYEIEATITQEVEGRDPVVTELSTVVSSDQEVVDVSDDGALVEVVLRGGGQAPKRAVVLLDRAGSLQAIEEVEGLPVSASLVPGIGALPTPHWMEIPRRPLRLGDRWTIETPVLSGWARVARLAAGGAGTATIEASLEERIDSTTSLEQGSLRMAGRLATEVATAYDLGDGAVERATTSSRGRVAIVIEPPAGVTASPVEATITYHLEVQTTRTR